MWPERRQVPADARRRTSGWIGLTAGALATAVLAWGVNALRPDGICLRPPTSTDVTMGGMPGFWTADQVREGIRSQRVRFIDVRPPQRFAVSHVQGAVNLPAEHPRAYTVRILRDLRPNGTYVIYAEGTEDLQASLTIAAYLVDQGFVTPDALKVFAEGWSGLQAIEGIVPVQEDGQ